MLARVLRQAQDERTWGLNQERTPLTLSLSKGPRGTGPKPKTITGKE